MGEVNTNYKLTVSVEDSKYKDFIKSVATLESAFGGATKAAVEFATKATAAAGDAANKQASITKKNQDSVIAAQQAMQAATERRIKNEERAENLKFNELKEQYKKNAKAIDDLNNAKKEATEKEAKAEIQIEINKQKELQQVYRKELAGRAETKKGMASDVGMLGTKREVSPTGGGVLSAVGIGAAITGLKALKQHAELADEANDQLAMGIAATGLQGKAFSEEQQRQAEFAKELSKTYRSTSEEQAKIIIANVATMSKKSGEQLKQASEDALILANGDAEKAAVIGKMLGKATNEEIESGATKLGIALDKTMTSEQRAAKIHEEAMKRKKAVQDADNDSLGAMQAIMNQVMTTVTTLAATVLDALKPAFDAVMPLVEQIGSLLVSILKPVLDALIPVVTVIAKAFSALAPVIVELVTSALGILTPILEEVTGILEQIIPVITEVVQTVLTALMPVFKALAPIIQELSQIFLQLFSAQLMGVIIPIIKDVFVPILTDLVVPVLLSLLPIIKMMADLFMKLVVPAVTAVSNIMKWLIDSAVQPLVKWFSGTLVGAINAVVGVAKEVIGVITDIVGAVGDLIGLGDDDAPKKAVAKQGVAVAKEEEIAQTKRTEVVDKAEELRRKKAEASAKKSTAAAGKAIKSKADVEKDAIEQAFIEQKAIIDTANSKGEITDAQAKKKLLEAQLKHDQDMLAVLIKYKQKTTQLKAAIAKDESELRKNAHAQLLADAKNDEEELLTQLEIRGLKENLSEEQIAKERYEIQRNALANEIELRRKNGDDVSKLENQLALMQLKNAKDAIKHEEEIQKDILDIKKKARKDELDMMRDAGISETEIQKRTHEIEAEEENERYAEEIKKRKDQLDNSKLGLALRESLEIDHQNKLNAIRVKADKEALERNKQYLADITTLAIANKEDRLAVVSDFAEKNLGIQNLAQIKERGGLAKFLKQNLAMIAQNQLAQLLTTTTAENSKTAVVTAGTLARGAALIGEGIASAASAAGTWVATAAQAVFNAFKALPFPLDLVAAGASVAGVVALATQVPKLFKHADGGVGVKPVTAGQHQFFEAGPEAVIPLSSGRSQSMIQTAFGFDKALAPVVDMLSSINKHSANTKVVLPINNSFENARNNYLKSEDRRSM